jgi:hypothetical protein
LDDAIDRLNPRDRTAIIQRFFEQRSLREIGRNIGASEDAMQKRIARALDRLRAILSGQGVSLTSGTLVSLISAHAVSAAPAGLALAVGGAAFAAALSKSVTPPALFNLMNLKLISAGAIMVTGIATVVFFRPVSEHPEPSVTQPAWSGKVSNVHDPAPSEASQPPPAEREAMMGIAMPNADRSADRANTDRMVAAATDSAAVDPKTSEPPFTAPVRTRVGYGQTLVTGGWATGRDKVTFVFVTPEPDDASGVVTYRSTFVEIPEQLILELGLGDFISDGKTSSLSDPLDGPEARLFLAALKESDGVNVLSTPTVMTRDGRQAKVNLGSPIGSLISLEFQGTMDRIGQALDLELIAEMGAGHEPPGP